MPHIKGDPTKPAPDLGLRGLPLLDYIIAYVEEHPETFDMKSWAVIRDVPGLDWDWGGQPVPATCRTAMCIAGWAAHLTGAEIIYLPQFVPDDDGDSLVLAATNVWRRNTRYFSNTEQISHYAARMLDLPPHLAFQLFDPCNSLDDVKELRSQYIEDGVWEVVASVQ